MQRNAVSQRRRPESPRILYTIVLFELGFSNRFLHLLRRAKVMKALRTIRQFLLSESGTTAVEYAVLLAMILIAIIIGVTSAGGGVSSWWGNIRTKVEAY